MSKSGMGKFVAGVAVGAGLGVLFAPKSGSETRAELKAKFEELYSKAKELNMEDVKEAVSEKIEEIKAAIADLDKEKVLAVAKEKARELQQKCQDLIDYVVEKGTPVMEKTATAIRDKSKEVSREVIEKLKKEEQEA